jgi:hypothetical protein
MPDESEQVLADDATERVVMFQLLRDDRPERWSREDLLSELYDVDPDAIGEALVSLAAVAAVILDSEHVRASTCAQRIDALGMIAI